MMEALQSTMEAANINESNSNHILDSSNIHNVEKENNGKMNGFNHLELINGLKPKCLKSSSTENEESTEVSELSHPDELQTNQSVIEEVEMTRELSNNTQEIVKITYKVYESELELPSIMKLIQKDLSEPYSIYTYRYFIHNWPNLCYLALHENKCIGCIVCKLDIHRQMIKRGYIAMLAVDKDYRKLKIGTTLVQKAIRVGSLILKTFIFSND